MPINAKEAEVLIAELVTKCDPRAAREAGLSVEQFSGFLRSQPVYAHKAAQSRLRRSNRSGPVGCAWAAINRVLVQIKRLVS
jgi:hypothetical protein